MMGERKFKRRNTKNAERKESASLKLIPRNRITVAVSEGLALSQLVPESLSPVDMCSGVPTSCGITPCLFTHVSFFNSWFGRIYVFFIKQDS